LKFVISPYQEILNRYPSDYYSKILSKKDREQSVRFVHKQDKDRFLASRLLCYREMSEIKPFSQYPVEFEIGVRGKPYLEDYPDFNWSHSGDLVALFIGPDAGIDIELMRWVKIAEFSSVFDEEQLYWIGDDLGRFFQLWTIKESIMKACGLGFHLDPLSIHLILSNDFSKWSTKIDDKLYFGATKVVKTQNEEKYAVSICSSSNQVELQELILPKGLSSTSIYIK